MQRIVMLPGWMHGADFWQPLASVVPAGCSALALDWDRVLDGEGLEELLSEMPGRVVIVGWSLGAMAALRLAAKVPGKVAGLVLAGATARLPAEPPEYPGVAMRRLRAMRLALRQDARACYGAFFELCGVSASDGTRLTQAALEKSLDVAGAGLDALMAWDLRGELDGVVCPVEMVHGSDDGVVGLAQAELLQRRLRCAELLVIAGEQHAPGAATWGALGQRLAAMVEAVR